MVARRLAVALLLACGAAGGFANDHPAHNDPANDPVADVRVADGQASASDPNQNQAPADGPTAGSSSSKPGHHKTTASSHHVEVAEEVAPSPDLVQAEALIQKRDYAGAEPLLHKVAEGDPANYVAWFELGYTENGLGKIDDSIAAYRKSVEAKADVFESNLNLGLQLAKRGDAEAEQFLRAATQLKPTNNVREGQARAWLSLGHVLETAKPGDAVGAYQQAAVLQPKDPEPHLAAGLLLEKQEKFADAEQEYKQALALAPSSDALTGLANIYMRGRRLPEAEAELRKLVAADPERTSAHIQLGRVLAAEGKNDAAIAELEAGAKVAPADTSLQRDLADLYAAAGKNDKAESAYRALIAGHPNDPELHRDLGKALLEQKKFGAAQQELLEAVKLKPDFGEAYGDLAFAAGENKEYPLTIKALDARVKFLPETAITYFLRASAYDHLRNMKQAAENYRLFLKAANGKYPEQEWQAKHRLIAIEPKR